MSSYYPNRMSEAGNIPFRSDRFFCVGGEWFFAIRRGPDQGPYASREAAREALKTFIEDQLSLERRLQAEWERMESRPR
jgi:hypothetical protein